VFLNEQSRCQWRSRGKEISAVNSIESAGSQRVVPPEEIENVRIVTGCHHLDSGERRQALRGKEDCAMKSGASLKFEKGTEFELE
jgi:hypothetical protein